MDSRRPRSRFATEHDPRGAEAKLGQVDPEDAGILVVVRVEGKAPVHRGYRAQGPERQLTAPHEDLGAEAGEAPRLGIGQLGGNRVPAAELAPDLGMVRNVGTDHLIRDAEQLPEQPGDLSHQPDHRPAGPVGEGHHPDPVAWSHPDLRVEAGKDALVFDSEMRAEIAPHERQTYARHPGIGLVVGLEHGGQRRRIEHSAVFVGAAVGKSRDVPGRIPRGGVDGARSRGHPLAVCHSSHAAGAQLVSRGQARLRPLRSEEVGVGHAEGLEDVLAKIAVERLPAHVLDDLAERGEPVVAVGEPGARLGRQAEAATIVLGQGGQWLSEIIALPALRQRRPGKQRHERPGRVRHLRRPAPAGRAETPWPGPGRCLTLAGEPG